MKGYFYALLLLSVAFTGITVNGQSPQSEGLAIPQFLSSDATQQPSQSDLDQGLATPQLLSSDVTLQPSQSALDQLESCMKKLIRQCGVFLPMFSEYMEGQSSNPSFLNQGIDILTLQVAMDASFNGCEDMMNVTAAYQIGEAMMESEGAQNPQSQQSPTAQMYGAENPQGPQSPMTAQMYGAQNPQRQQSPTAAPLGGAQNSPTQPPSTATTMGGPQTPQS